MEVSDGRIIFSVAWSMMVGGEWLIEHCGLCWIGGVPCLGWKRRGRQSMEFHQQSFC